MIQTKRLLTAAAVAGILSLAVLSNSSFASGPLVLVPRAPVSTAKVFVVNTTSIKTQILNSYRQVRAFWLSRAIVR
jgi:hypothetical protein